MSFEIFDARGRDNRPTVPSEEPFVTVTDNRLLLVNRAATEALGAPGRTEPGRLRGLDGAACAGAGRGGVDVRPEDG